jgi:hypothetical protein
VGEPARFKQADIKRAVRGVVDAGVRVGRVEIDPNGNIVIFTAEAPAARRGGNSWDRVL